MKNLSIAAITLSSIALLVSVVAFIKPSPAGKNMRHYDFSTPEEALKSQLEMRKNTDIIAHAQYITARNRKAWEEEADSLTVHDSVDYDGKKILFTSFKKDGKVTFDIDSFEKDADSGDWYSTYVSTYKMPDNSEMKKRIEDWKAKSEE